MRSPQPWSELSEGVQRVDIVDGRGRVKLGLVYCHEPNDRNGAASVGWYYIDAEGCRMERCGGGPLTAADLKQERSA
jgi:hypothetical protein